MGDAVARFLGYVVEEVCNERTSIEVANIKRPEAGSWTTFFAGTEYQVVIRADRVVELLRKGIFISRDRCLWWLGTLLDVFGVWTCPIFAVVDALPKRLVALLEAHDKGTDDVTFGNFEHAGNTYEVCSGRVYPKLGEVKLETHGEFVKFKHWLKVDQTWKA